MDRDFVEHFARDWIEAWNAHDLDRILTHYTEDFVMHSPYIRQLAGVAEGHLQGKQAVGDYWCKALERMPDLRFELICALAGVSSITLHYRGAGGRLAAEVFHFTPDGLVHTAYAHYAV